MLNFRELYFHFLYQNYLIKENLHLVHFLLIAIFFLLKKKKLYLKKNIRKNLIMLVNYLSYYNVIFLKNINEKPLNH